jgi:hypothetical protein
MAVSDHGIGFGSAPEIPETLRRSGNIGRRTPEEEEAFLRDHCVVSDRRRREWAKRRRAAERRRANKGRHPARDREALKRLQAVAADTGSEDAATIARKLGDCIAGKCRCRLWVCSRCSSERSQDQVERLVCSLADVDRSDLAAFTIVLGAVGLGGIDAALAAAAEARRQVERLRQRTKRAGLDLSYWGQVELAFSEPHDSEDGDHCLATLAEISAECLHFDEVLVPHVHGLLRLGAQTSLDDVRRHLRAIFPASRQVVVKSLREDQTKEEAISAWGKYATKSEVKTKRSVPKEWFAGLLSGEQLLALSVFQRALKLRSGRFSYHFSMEAVEQKKTNDDEDYYWWLFGRRETCRKNDRLYKSYDDEMRRISKEKWEQKKSYYTTPVGGIFNDPKEERQSVDNRTRRSSVFDCGIHARPDAQSDSTGQDIYRLCDQILPRPGPVGGLLAVRPDHGGMGHAAGLGHSNSADWVPDG